MKRFLFVLLAVALIVPLALTGCAAKKGTAGNKFRIAVSLPPANNAWQAKMLTSIEDVVKEDTAALRDHREERGRRRRPAEPDADLQGRQVRHDLHPAGQRHPDDPDLLRGLQGRHQDHDHRPAHRGRGLHRLLRRRQQGVRAERRAVHRQAAGRQGPDRGPAQLRRDPHRPGPVQRVPRGPRQGVPGHQDRRRSRRRVQPGSGPQGDVEHPARVPEDRRRLLARRREPRSARSPRSAARSAPTSSSSPAWAARTRPSRP